MRVLTIFARFGTERYPDAERQVDAIFGRQMPDVERHVVVVDNALPAGLIERSAGRTLLGGDNTFREFTAFDRAIEHLRDELSRYDLVNLVTSAFNNLYVDYLERFDTALLRAVVGRPVCVGHIDCYNEPVEILGYHTQHWIRSCFFILHPVDLKLLGRLTTVRDAATFFTGSADAPFRADAPLSANYQAYITDWLTGRDIGQGVSWHSSFALTEDAIPTFQGKALAIMNEHLLSVRMRALACRTIDVTWLATILRQGGGTIPWDVAWRDQLANRDRDAVRIAT